MINLYSVAYVTNNKRLRLTFRTIEATTDRHGASRDLFATAELLVDCFTLQSAGPFLSCCEKPIHFKLVDFIKNVLSV